MNMRYYNLITAKELQTKEFPPINWIVNDILPEGLSILAGKPKLGKSWAALDLGCAVSEGAKFLGKLCEKGDVIYLALEDNERRLKERLQLIRPEGIWADNFHLKTEWPILNENEMIKDISKYANISYDNCKKTLKRMYHAGQVVKVNHHPLRYGLKLDPLEIT